MQEASAKPKIDVLNCHPFDEISREEYPDAVGLHLTVDTVEIIGLNEEGVLESIPWQDVVRDH